MATLTQEQIEKMQKNGLSLEKIQTLAEIRGDKLPVNIHGKDVVQGVERSGIFEKKTSGQDFLRKAGSMLGGSVGTVLGSEKGKEFMIGGLKSSAKSAKNVLGFAEKTGNLLLGQGFTTSEYSPFSEETELGKKVEEALRPDTLAEKAGATVSEIAQFGVPAPGSKLSTGSKAVNFIGKIAGRAARSGSVATVQEGELGKEAGLAAGAEAAIPVFGAVLKGASGATGRIFNGILSNIGGRKASILTQVRKNPELAQKAIKELGEKGNLGLIEENAKVFTSGVKKIRKEASKAYGEALEKLGALDVDKNVVGQNTRAALEANGVSIDDGVLTFNEITDDKIAKKATDLIETVNNFSDWNGKSVSRLIKDIDAKAFKNTGGDPNRQALNSLISDVKTALKESVASNNTILQEANQAYSGSIQLAEAVESIMGKNKYNSLKEVDRVARQLENLFNKKGLDPKRIDDFLTEVGVSPDEFKTSEAVRQISTAEGTGSKIGTTISEMLNAFSSGVVTPELVRDISIKSGIAEQALTPILERLEPAARAAFVKTIVGSTD